jgi:hypothetical protein
MLVSFPCMLVFSVLNFSKISLNYADLETNVRCENVQPVLNFPLLKTVPLLLANCKHEPQRFLSTANEERPILCPHFLAQFFKILLSNGWVFMQFTVLITVSITSLSSGHNFFVASDSRCISHSVSTQLLVLIVKLRPAFLLYFPPLREMQPCIFQHSLTTLCFFLSRSHKQFWTVFFNIYVLFMVCRKARLH